MKVNRARLAAWAAFAAMTAGLVPLAQHPGVAGGVIGAAVAQAQNLGQRNVTGSVVDGGASPVAGATVFLKNVKTKSIRSYTSGGNGRFRFAQVNMVDDYDLWAEKDGKKSVTKSVSSWDTRKEFETELKMK